MRRSGKILVTLALVVIIALLARNFIIRGVAERMIEQTTGMKADIGSIDIGILRPVVEIRDVELINPPEFPDREAFKLKTVFVRYNRSSLFSDKIELDEVTIDIESVVMVRNEEGKRNIDQLMDAAKADKKSPEPGASKPSGSGSAPSESSGTDKPPKDVSIDNLTVRFGDMKVIDHYKKPDQPAVYDIPVNMDRSYQNVTNINDVALYIGTEMGLRAAPALIEQAMQNLDREKLDKNLDRIAEQARGFLEKLGVRDADKK